MDRKGVSDAGRGSLAIVSGIDSRGTECIAVGTFVTASRCVCEWAPGAAGLGGL